MGKREFMIKAGSVPACPKCGNQDSFVAQSDQFSEDCCEVWIECECGYDPTLLDTDTRMEDVWGVLDEETIRNALSCTWIDLVRPKQAALAASS